MGSSIVDKHWNRVRRIAKNAVNRAIAEGILDKDGPEKLIENGDEFQTRIIAGIKDLSVSNQPACPVGRFADEEVYSSFAYPKGYKVKGITEQTNILRQLVSGIGFADEKLAEQQLPPNAEGWYAMPKWQTLAPTYGEAVEKVFAMIASQREFCNHCDGKIGAKHLRQHAKTVKMFQKLGDEQKDHNILVVPAQFGLHHRDRTVRRAREVFAGNEFGLGAFASGIMLLTHPEREVQWDQLHIDCAGDEFAPDGGGRFSRAPVLYFAGGMLRFFANDCGLVYGNHGSASGFLSQ